MAGHKGALRIAIEDFLDTFNFGVRIANGIANVTVKPREAMLNAVKPIIKEILDTKDLPEKYKKPLRDVTSTEPITLTVVAGAVLLALIVGTVMGIYQPIQRVIAQWVDAGVESRRADPSIAWPMTWRTPEHSVELMKHMKQMGWNETIIAAWQEAARPRPGAGDLITLMLRGDISPDVVTKELVKRGYTDADSKAVIKLARMIPGPADLIRMGVREAWRDDVAAKYGYDSDFPSQFADWMKKQGDQDGWAQKYWRAHWDLPGLTTVLEILHRVPGFGLNDLEEYLRIADVPATWRKWIGQIAYTPYTRVDTRRMYSLGVLSEADVYRNYRDIGYDDEHARNMTEFTIKYEAGADRELTKTDILGAYNTGMLSKEEAIEWLSMIAYPRETAEFLVAREESEAAKKLIAQKVGYIKTLYTGSQITEGEARSRLAALGITQGEIATYLTEWTVTRDAKVKKPTQSQLDSFLLQDIILEPEYIAGLKGLGYQDKYVDWYLRGVLQDKAEKAAKEEERARTEQDSIRTRKVKSDYQIAKAGIDVDIAELQCAIAETQLAQQTRKNRYQEEIVLVREALTVAELKDRAASDIRGLELDIRTYQEVIAVTKERIEQLQTQIRETELAVTPRAREVTAGEMAVEIRSLEVQQAELRESIEGLQTEIAAIKLEAAGYETPEEVEAASTSILEAQYYIEVLQDAIAAIDTEIAQIRETGAIYEREIDPEDAKRLIAQYNLDIEVAQDQIAESNTLIATTRTKIEERRAQLYEDTKLLERLKDVAAVEAEYRADIATLSERLYDLRFNLAQLREAKAQLTVEFRGEIAD